MERNCIFSIIMPIYNVESYLRDAVSSVLAQTYSHFELVLVDDCSPDDSPAICDELAATDPRIKVIHKPKNEGVSMARNSALDVAIGDYIYFMDSDDAIDNTLLQYVAESLREKPAQIIMFGMVEEQFSKSGKLIDSCRILYPQKSFQNQESLRKEVIYLEKSTLYGYVWNKCYNANYLKNLKIIFPIVSLNEDIFFNIACFMHAETLNILGTAPYHYKKRNTTSLTARFVADYFDLHKQRVQMIKDQYVSWGLYTNKVRNILGNIYCRYIFSALQRNCDPRSDMRHKDRKQWVQNLFASKLYADIIPAADPESYMVRVLTGMLKRKQVTVCLISARVIYFIKTAFPLVFAKLKQNR